MSWNVYLSRTATYSPRDLLVQATSLVPVHGAALDLGCGAGVDARYLHDKGFDVTAVDSNPDVKKYVENIAVVISSFADFEYGVQEYILVNAQYALPFNPPNTFGSVFKRVTESLKPGGIFVGQFFGPEDDWAGRPTMNFHSRAEVESLLDAYDVLVLREENKEGSLAAGGTKHWHVFHVIAQKR